MLQNSDCVVCIFIAICHTISVKHNSFLVYLNLQKTMFSVMFSTLELHFQLLKPLMRGKHLKLVAAEESFHTLHSSLNVQLLFST